VAAFRAPEKVDIVIVASDGQTLRLPLDSVSVQGRGASGVAGMKLKPGAAVVGAGALIGDGVVITVTSERGAKSTPYGELPAKGRGGQGVRIARLADGETIRLIYSGRPDFGLLAQMADDDDPKKLDPNPVPFEIEATNRDLVPVRTERQVRVLAPGRW
jgi:DNA gyrase subunit A